MMKYLYGFKLNLLQSLNYRINTVVNIVFSYISILVDILFWVIIYNATERGIINGYNLYDMITYYLVGILIRNFTFIQSGFSMCDLILNGDLSGKLLKPYCFSIDNYLKNLTTAIVGVIPQIVFMIILSPFIVKYWTWKISIVSLLYFIIFILISTLTSFFVWSIIGYMAFWIDDAKAAMWSFSVLFNFISGMFIPLDFFPEWGYKVIEYLPSSTWQFIPTKIFLGQYDTEKIVQMVWVNICWVLFLGILNRIVWSQGIKKYSSVGG